MKIAAIASTVGFAVGISVSAAWADFANPVAAPHALLSSEAVVVAEHFDRRIDRLERLVGAVASDLDMDAGNTRTEIQNAKSSLEEVCKNR